MKNLLSNFLVFKNSAFYKDFSKLFFKVLILWLLFAIFEGAGISLFYPIVELLQYGEIQGDNLLTKYLLEILTKLGIPPSVLIIFVMTFFILSIRFYLNYVKQKTISHSVHKVEFNIRNKLIESLYGAKLDYLYKKKDGDWLSSFSYDVVRARHVINNLTDFLGNIFLMTIYVLILSLISFQLLIYCLPVFFIAVIILKSRGNFYERIGKKLSNITSNYFSIHEDVMKNLIFIKMRNLVSFFETKLKNENREISFSQYSLSKENFKIESYFGFLLLFAVFYILIISKIKLNLELYQIALFLFILNRIAPSLQITLKSLLNFLVNFQSLRVIIQLSENAHSNREELRGKKNLKEEIKSVLFENACFKHEENNNNIFTDLSFKIEKGESMALIGSSGSGKSTLLNILTGFYKISKGKISINDKNINNIDLRYFRKKISYLPQNPELFNDTIKNNLLLGISRNIEEDELIYVLNECYCDFVFRLPKKLESTVGDKGMLISGGQRQRLVIARAILNKSELIILDEATSGLDEKSESKIKATLRKIKNDTIQIISSHRISTIENTDKLLYLGRSEFNKFGQTKKLLNDNRIRNLFNKN